VVKVLIGGVESVEKVVLESDSNVLEQALEYRSEMSGVGYCSIREYLTKLLLTVWEEQEMFNGKRPFGNSGWYLDVFDPLFTGGFIRGERTFYNDDPEDYMTDYHQGDESLPGGDEFVKNLINRMCSSKEV
jgi:hypothetical protein